MKVRDCEPSDLPRLQELFNQHGFEYDLPDLSRMLSAKVVESDGAIVQAILARTTVEVYMLGDQQWSTPALRFAALQKIHEAMRQELVIKGIEDVHCWLPPQVAKSFGRRLRHSFGWAKPLWEHMTRSTAPREFRKAS